MPSPNVPSHTDLFTTSQTRLRSACLLLDLGRTWGPPETSFTLPDLSFPASGLSTGLLLSKAVWVQILATWPWVRNLTPVPPPTNQEWQQRLPPLRRPSVVTRVTHLAQGLNSCVLSGPPLGLHRFNSAWNNSPPRANQAVS